MDPQQQSSTGPEYSMPPAAGDMIPVIPGQETAPASPETASQPSAPSTGLPPAPAAAPPIIDATGPSATAAPMPPTPSSNHPSAPVVADDLDLIEKEWVDKAKAIVAKTRTDPHAQNKEMNLFKADYMKKRYAKEIKIEP